MSFFDFFKNANNAPAAPASSEAATSNEPVIIFVTPGNEVEVPADEAANTTVSVLFERYADVLGIDPEQIERYTDQGRVIQGSATPAPGRLIQGSASSFTKG